MKPSLTEVKEYFKNAKEVKGTIGIYTDIISSIKSDEIYYSENGKGYYIEDSNHNGDFCVYCCELNEYAKIISYKEEETLPIKKSTLLQLAENNSFSESIIKKEFPQLFENELEVGKWYFVKHETSNDALIFLQSKDVTSTYGFNHVLEYTNTYSNYLLHGKYKKDIIRKATEQEVFEALKNEAIKRGFKEGAYIHRPFWNDLKDCIIDKDNFPEDMDYFYDFRQDYFEVKGFVVYSKGQWAEILPQPKQLTISEIEKILGYKILIKE
jgi:hypothetical protein